MPKRGYRPTGSLVASRPRRLASRHRVASLLKRWLWVRIRAATSREHLDYYLDEFHLSVQSTNLTPSREALPSAPGTGRGGPVPYAAMVKGIRSEEGR